MSRLLVWMLALLPACGGLVEPVGPRAMEPGPAQYEAQALLASCVGVTVPVASVSWFSVEAIRGHRDAVGAWNRPNVIYLLDGFTDNVKVSAHELLHHVLRGDPGHKNRAWLTCGVWP